MFKVFILKIKKTKTPFSYPKPQKEIWKIYLNLMPPNSLEHILGLPFSLLSSAMGSAQVETHQELPTLVSC